MLHLQVRADRIQSDLEELAKALSDRCKQRGINVKTTASVELPFGNADYGLYFLLKPNLFFYFL